MRACKVTKSRHKDSGHVLNYPVNDTKYDVFTLDATFHQFMQESEGDSTWVVAVVEYETGSVEAVGLAGFCFV